MTAEEREMHLHAYIDGELSAAEARRFEEELAQDPALRLEERDLRTLIENAADLPTSIPPSRDLWPDLMEQLERGEAWHRRSHKRGTQFYRLPSFWAAAVLLTIAGSSIIAMFTMQVGPSVPLNLIADIIGRDNLSTESMLVAFKEQEAEYIRASSELRLAYARQRRALSEETSSVVDDNLAIIDSAILEMQRELSKDPANEAMKERLLAMYERQVHLLRQARDLDPAS